MITKSEVADALITNDRHNAAARAIFDTLDEFELRARPQFAGVNDPELKRYFVIETSNERIAERVLSKLPRHKAVEAVYQKPPDELPT